MVCQHKIISCPLETNSAKGHRKGGLWLNGPSDRIRTCGILLPNKAKQFFLVIYRAFPCFLVGSRYSFGICKSAFHRCPGAVCGHLCGQKRFPPKTGGFAPAQDGKRFRISVCRIVTLSRRLCKSFLRGTQFSI